MFKDKGEVKKTKVNKKNRESQLESEGNISDEEGENIEDEDNERNNTMSYLKCKPSKLEGTMDNKQIGANLKI